MFPAGFARLETKSLIHGIADVAITMGILPIALFAALTP
jgi:hypothetical protein